ncbi:hypothetical protein [Pseudomonas sp. COR18]|uniref:hypothetical protein n=1 Tax=Pseudomonas sp. COR18 TaxID=3399680 RepID=UPI003B009037
MKASTLIFISLTAVTAPAQASSPDQWIAHDKAVLASCTKASHLKNVKPVGSPALFDDKLGYTAVLLRGHYPQAHMKNQAGTELCLYNRKSKSASVTEWDSVMPARSN